MERSELNCWASLLIWAVFLEVQFAYVYAFTLRVFQSKHNHLLEFFSLIRQTMCSRPHKSIMFLQSRESSSQHNLQISTYRVQKFPA